MSKIKKQLFIPIIVAIVFVWLIAIFSFSISHSKTLSQNIESEIKLTEAVIDGKIKGEVVQLRLLADAILENNDLTPLLDASDSRTLYRLLSPVYQKLNENTGINNLIFIKPDKVCFLRIHDKGKFGDTIQRHSLLKAIALKRPYFFMEPGIYSDINLRVIVPVLRNDLSIAGYVEVSKPVTTIFNFIDSAKHLEFSLSVNKALLKKEDWVKYMKLPYQSWELHQQYVFYFNSLDTVEEADISDLMQDTQNHKIEQIKLKGKRFYSRNLPIPNIDGSPFGTLKLLYDRTLYEKELQNAIILFTIISLIIILAEAYILYKIIDKTEKKLSRYQADLALELNARKAADEQLIKTNKQLEELTYIAAHDLKAPLANLQSIANVFKNEIKDPNLQELVGFMQSSSNSIYSTLDGINMVIEASEGMSETKKIIELKPFVDEIILSLQHLIKEKEIIISTNFSGCNTLFMVPAHLKSIFQNLIANSIKFYDNAKSHRWIRIECHEENEFKVITFADNGIGIDLNIHDKNLFKLFKRFQSDIDGKGMGLYLTKLFVDNYEGAIEVKSKPGEGTTFIIKLKV